MMPKFPTDMAKCAAATKKSRARLAQRKRKAAKEKQQEAAKLEQLRADLSEAFGLEAGQITGFICHRGRKA